MSDVKKIQPESGGFLSLRIYCSWFFSGLFSCCWTIKDILTQFISNTLQVFSNHSESNRSESVNKVFTFCMLRAMDHITVKFTLLMAHISNHPKKYLLIAVSNP